MRIKIVTLNGFEWKEVDVQRTIHSLKNNYHRYYHTNGDYTCESKVLKIEDDFREKDENGKSLYVASSRNDLIRNTPEEIEKYFSEYEETHRCTNCSLFRVFDEDIAQCVLSLGGETGMLSAPKDIFKCAQNGKNVFDTQEDASVCQRFNPRRNGVKTIPDTPIVQYPRMYEQMPTERLLYEKGWKPCNNSHRDYVSVDTDAEVYASLTNGVCYRFQYNYDNFWYSPIYDKLFLVGSNIIQNAEESPFVGEGVLNTLKALFE